MSPRHPDKGSGAQENPGARPRPHRWSYGRWVPHVLRLILNQAERRKTIGFNERVCIERSSAGLRQMNPRAAASLPLLSPARASPSQRRAC